MDEYGRTSADGMIMDQSAATGVSIDHARCRVATLPYRIIAGVALASFALITTFKLVEPLAETEYVHRLVSYDLGLIRRGLVGDVYSHLTNWIHPAVVKMEGLAAIAVAAALFGAIFLRAFPFSSVERLAVACFLFGSPLLFKNFAGNLAKLDVYGAIVAMIAFLMPLSLLSYVVIFFLSATLLLVHHIHATMYIPTIVAIVVLRSAAAGRWQSWRAVLTLAVCVMLLIAEFLFLMFKAAPAIPREEFLTDLRGRSLQPLTDYAAFMWYSTLGEELAGTRNFLLGHAVRLPIYAAIILLHLPIVRLLAVRGRLSTENRPGVYKIWIGTGVIVIFCYLIMMSITYDYARFLGNLAFCLTLLSLSVIPALRHDQPVLTDNAILAPNAICCAAVLAALPWTGTIFPLF